MKSKTIALVAVISAGVLGSAVAGVAKKGLGEIPPYSYTFLRFVVASLCVMPFLFTKQGKEVLQIRKLTPVSLFATANVVLFILGVNLTTANVGSVIYAAVPLLTALIIFLFFRTRLSLGKELGIVFGFIGVLIITFLPLFEKGNPFAGSLFGNLLLTMAVILWSFYLVFSKKLQQRYSPMIITSHFIFLSTLIMFPFFAWESFANPGWWNHVTGWGIFSVFYMGAMITVLNYLLNQYAIKHGGAVLASMMFYIMPVLGFIVNFFLLGELLTVGFIIGSLIAFFGTYLVVRK